MRAREIEMARAELVVRAHRERPHRLPPSTPADHERLRLAAQKRARKAAKLKRTVDHGS